MNFVTSIIANSLEGFVEAGTRTAGGYAGDAIIKAGDMIENGGRNVGNGVENAATRYGAKISGQGVINTTANLPKKALPAPAAKKALPAAPTRKALPAPERKALPAPEKKKTAHPSAVSRSHYNPNAPVKPRTPVGAKKYAGGVVSGANKVASTVTSTATKKPSLPAISAPKSLPKPFPEVPAAPSRKSARSNNKKKAKELPMPYPNDQSWPGAEKKTPVKPGQTNNFNKPNDPPEVKPYPGTNTLPNSGSRTPVKKYKPLERHAPPAKPGEFKHI